MRFSSLRNFKPDVFQPLAFLGLAIACFSAILLFSLPSLTAAPNASIQFVSPAWVTKNASDPNLRILDVRNAPLEYIDGHLPNAVNIADIAFRGPHNGLPLQYWEKARIAEIFAQSGVTDTSRVLVYSDGKEVLGATMVAYLLERSGLRDIAVLNGGYAGYQGSQQVTKAYPTYKPGKFTLRDNPSLRVAIDQVKSLLGKPQVVFMDARPDKLFRGEDPLWMRNGHIPCARSVPWVSLVETSNPHRLKPLEAIQQILTDKQVTPDKDIIIYCSTGREATLEYVVLKHLLGYPKVRIYEGSWTEYSSSKLPVETGPERTL